MSAAPAIEAEGLWKVFGPRAAETVRAIRDRGLPRAEAQARYRSVVAVADVSLAVAPGEIFCVMGLSGSGKSTLVRQLNGLIPATAGEVRIGGQPLSRLSPAALRALRARRIAMVFQHFGLLPHRNVLDNAAFGLELRGVARRERRARALEALAAMRLADWAGARIDELSGGMQQRVGIARALAGDGDILLLDEPFSALDPLIRRELQDQFLELSRRLGKTAVFITHDADEALRLGARVAIMREGRIVQTGGPAEIVLRPADDYVAAFLRGASTLDVLRARDLIEPGAPPEGCAPVAADTTLRVLARAAAAGGRDLAVAGPDGRPLGRVPVGRVLAALAAQGEAPPAAPGPAAAAEGAAGDGRAGRSAGAAGTAGRGHG